MDCGCGCCAICGGGCCCGCWAICCGGEGLTAQPAPPDTVTCMHLVRVKPVRSRAWKHACCVCCPCASICAGGCHVKMVLPGLAEIGVEMLLPGGPETRDNAMVSCRCSPSACTVNCAR